MVTPEAPAAAAATEGAVAAAAAAAVVAATMTGAMGAATAMAGAGATTGTGTGAAGAAALPWRAGAAPATSRACAVAPPTSPGAIAGARFWHLMHGHIVLYMSMQPGVAVCCSVGYWFGLPCSKVTIPFSECSPSRSPRRSPE